MCWNDIKGSETFAESLTSLFLCPYLSCFCRLEFGIPKGPNSFTRCFYLLSISFRSKCSPK